MKIEASSKYFCDAGVREHTTRLVLAAYRGGTQHVGWRTIESNLQQIFTEGLQAIDQRIEEVLSERTDEVETAVWTGYREAIQEIYEQLSDAVDDGDTQHIDDLDIAELINDLLGRTAVICPACRCGAARACPPSEAFICDTCRREFLLTEKNHVKGFMQRSE